MTRGRDRRGRVLARAPASVTVAFAPPPPGAAGDRSRGASLALADGVTVAFDPAPETTVTVDGDPADFAPVEGVLDRLGTSGAVDVRPEVPLGAGFGASGAATLATALAADAAADGGRDRATLVEAAHRAEVAAGTGLGDVFVQDVGGVVRSRPDGRTDPNAGTDPGADDRTGEDRGATADAATDGAPPGTVRTVPSATVAYDSFGGIDTAAVLGDDAAMARIRAAGTTALADIESVLGGDVDDGPSDPGGDRGDAGARDGTAGGRADAPPSGLRGAFAVGWRFARETGLVTDRVRSTVGAVEAAGGRATMAMVGETVVGVDAGDVLPNRTRVAARGARLLDRGDG